jgi:hypothetical protein
MVGGAKMFPCTVRVDIVVDFAGLCGADHGDVVDVNVGAGVG